MGPLTLTIAGPAEPKKAIFLLRLKKIRFAPPTEIQIRATNPNLNQSIIAVLMIID